ESKTKATKFGLAENEKISGNLKALGQTREFTSKPITNGQQTEGHTGITVPSMRVEFVMPETIVTGSRIKSATVSGIRSSIASIPLAAPTAAMPANVIGNPNFTNDQLFVT